MKIAFWGTSEFVGAVEKARFLRRLIAAGMKPALVVTAPDAPDERRQGFTPGAVKAAALEFDIPLLQPRKLEEFSGELARRGVELSLVAAYGKILPAEVLAVPKFGSLNVHPSLLPRWRGPTPIQAAILAGDSVTGATVICMDEQMDHGPIVVKREFELGDRAWTAPELSDALTDLGVELFLGVLEPWALGKIVPQPQDHKAATYSRMLKKEDGHISWSKPAVEIECMVRAFQPWPGAYAFWPRGKNGVRLMIEEADLAEAAAYETPGKIWLSAGGFCVATGQGALRVTKLRPEGRRSMPAEDFVRGHRDIIGAVLE